MLRKGLIGEKELLPQLYEQLPATVHVNNFDTPIYKSFRTRFSSFVQAMNTYYEKAITANANVWNEVKQKLQSVSYISKLNAVESLLLNWNKAKNTLSMMTQSYNGQDIEDEVLKYSKIVFSTLSTSGQKRLESMGKINSLIIDEAGQSVEAETLIPLQWGPKKCLLIGDIKQLPATVISQDAKELKFSRSLMERLINDCKQPYSMLDTQYRMNLEISRFPNSKY